MKNRSKLALRRSQLDRKLLKIKGEILASPPTGWLKAIRESMGMSAEQLAQRLAITRQSVTEFERGEKDGTISLKTMKRIAAALSCDVCVLLIPREPLETMIEKRAEEVAKKIVSQSEMHMNLENQGTSASFQKLRVKEIAADLVRNSDKKLWEKT